MSSSLVEFETQDQIGILRFNRPEVHNAVNRQVMDELESILETLDPTTRCLIVTGTGGETFCAGGDLRYFASLRSREDVLEMSSRMQSILERLNRGTRVVIAAINGQALGGGCEILTACHYRIAAENARFSFRQAKNGITTGWGGGERLLRQLGRSRALDLLLTSRTVSAHEGLQLGLIDRVVATEVLEKESLALATAICENSKASVEAFLELSHCFETRSRHDTLSLETQRFADGWTSKTFTDLLSRFE